jgi:large subunit ribosomal protein L24
MAVLVKKFKKGDMVQVMSGKDRGKQARILSIFQRTGRLSLEGVFSLRKHRRPRKQGEKGEIVTLSRPVAASKIQLVCPHCHKPTRIGFMTKNRGKERVCRKCDSSIS